MMQAPGPSQRSLRRSPGAEPGPPPNVPARSISPAVGLAGSVQPRSSTASARSNHSNERNSTNSRRPGVSTISPSSLPCWGSCQRLSQWQQQSHQKCIIISKLYPPLFPLPLLLPATTSLRPIFAPSTPHTDARSHVADFRRKRLVLRASVANRKERHAPPRSDQTTPRNVDTMVSRPSYRHPSFRRIR